MKRRIIDLAEVSELKRQYKSEQLQVLRCMEQKTADSNRIIVLMEEIISLKRILKKKHGEEFTDKRRELVNTKIELKKVESELEKVEGALTKKKARMESELEKVEGKLMKKEARLGEIELLEGKIEEVTEEGIFWKTQYETLKTQQESIKAEHEQNFQLMRVKYKQVLAEYKAEHVQKHQLLSNQYSQLLVRLNHEIGRVAALQRLQDYNEMKALLTPEEIHALLFDPDEQEIGHDSN